MRSGTAIFIVLAIALVLPAQSPRAASASPTFDAASVKPGGPWFSGSLGFRGGPGTSDPSRITFPRTLLQAVLLKAYDIRIDQLSGPAWLSDFSNDDSNYFAITATMPPDTTPERFQLMLRNLLTERFHLVVHYETRPFPGYELVVADGGPKLTPAAPEDAFDPEKLRTPPTQDRSGFPVRRPGSPGATMMPRPGTWGMIRSSNRITMAKFTQSLGAMVNESTGAPNTVIPRVVDKTGLPGIYEFTLEFAGMVVPAAGLPGADAAPAASDPGEAGPTLFAAVEKQLGLKLQKVKSVPVDVLVVDHVDKVPVGN